MEQEQSCLPLKKMLDLSHPLCRLGDAINWKKMEKHFATDSSYGRRPKETRLIVGLYYLKCAFNLSDEVLLECWLENPYWQYFCGETEFQRKLPLDRTTMIKWRRELDSKKFDKLLEETIDLGLDLGVLKRADVKVVNVDTTVMEKAIAFPTDIRLCHKAREKLVSLCKKEGILLRQSYIRKSKNAVFKYGRYRHARHYRRANKELRNVKNYLGRVIRDIERKCPAEERSPLLVKTLSLAMQVYKQKKQDKNKLYSLHAPEVECIAKGKSHKKYEFGCKVGVVTSSKSNFILGIQAFHGNPYDGHTLEESLSRAKTLSKMSIKEAYVDQGYKGHGVSDVEVNIVNWNRKDISRSKRKKMKRRSAIEPVIGHMKNDFGNFRNQFHGKHGDKIAALFLGIGFNLRKIFKKINKFRNIVEGFPDTQPIPSA